ncbi:MAG: ATP-binding protein [Cellvibrionaceae bacterium]
MKSLLEQTFLQVNIGILVIDKDYNITLCNHLFADINRKNSNEIIGKNLFELYSDLPKQWLQRKISSIFLLKNSSFISWEQRPSLFNLPSSRPITGTNAKMIQNCSLFPILDEENQVTHVCITINDATATALTQSKLKKTSKRLSQEKEAQQALIAKLEETKNQLLQSEKMASIGQLSAGVAHEINNPVGFIKSNFNSLKHYAKELNTVINLYQEKLDSIGNDTTKEFTQKLNDDYDIEFITEDIENLLTESFDGINRIEEIVKSLKHFSRADTNEWEKANINLGIESTLKVVAHELKYIAEIEKDFNELPEIECLPMQINQVLMNLLVNAGQAIEKDSKNGKISIATNKKDDKVHITIKDNGKGIKQENLTKIFDPFFTTKPVGEGTGLGLSLSYSIIQKHSGDISAHSELGKGTCFQIALPIHQSTEQNIASSP